MLFHNRLYKIEDLQNADAQEVSAVITLDKTHPIFEGHFPGQPILPGVCTVQIITELLAIASSKKWQILDASNIKFTNVVNPLEETRMQFSIKIKPTEAAEQYRIDAEASRGEGAGINCLKMKAIFECQNKFGYSD